MITLKWWEYLTTWFKSQNIKKTNFNTSPYLSSDYHLEWHQPVIPKYIPISIYLCASSKVPVKLCITMVGKMSRYFSRISIKSLCASLSWRNKGFRSSQAKATCKREDYILLKYLYYKINLIYLWSKEISCKSKVSKIGKIYCEHIPSLLHNVKKLETWYSYNFWKINGCRNSSGKGNNSISWLESEAGRNYCKTNNSTKIKEYSNSQNRVSQANHTFQHCDITFWQTWYIYWHTDQK